MATTETPVATINVGTRRSALALAQAEAVVAALRAAHPALTFAIQARDTAGDRDKTTALPSLGKGLWTTEFEERLAAGELDIVVHSAKDMPTSLPAGCALGAVPEREDPRDAVIFAARQEARGLGRLADLPPGSVVGTSSVRRTAQLRRRYPALRFADMRGNIDTRLRKLDAEGSGYDCIILAAAGLKRLGLGGRIAQYLDSTTEGEGGGKGGILHAVGQGALGIEVREGDARVLGLLDCVTDLPTMLACLAERAVMRALEGGCSVPIGVETAWEGRTLTLRATVVSLDGTEGVDTERAEEVSSPAEAEALGRRVAQVLVEGGAQKILDAINLDRAIQPAPTAAAATAS